MNPVTNALVSFLILVPVIMAQEVGKPAEIAVHAGIAQHPAPGKGGSPLRLVVTVTNLSDHLVTMIGGYEGSVPIGYRIDLRDANGKTPPFTQEGCAVSPALDGTRPACRKDENRGKVPRRVPVGSARGIYLGPGKSVTEEFELDSLYEFAPGSYTVKARRWGPQTNDKTASNVMVESNPVTLVLTAAQAQEIASRHPGDFHVIEQPTKK